MRVVPIPDKAREIIEALKKRKGRIIDLTKGAARHGFDRARKKAGLETLRFHDLRHIAISRMWSCGMNALEISCLLYTSPSPRDQRGSRMPSSA